MWEEIKVGIPIVARSVFAARPSAAFLLIRSIKQVSRTRMIVGDPPVVVGFEGVGEIEELGPGVTGFSVGERVCTCLPPLGAYSQERLYPG